MTVHRHKNGINHLKTGVSAFVTKFIQPVVSGKILTADPHIGDRSKIIVQISTDYLENLVDRKSLSIITRLKRAVDRPHIVVKNSSIEPQKLRDYEIIALAKLGAEIENHFYFPQIIDWVKEQDTISILNVRSLNFYAEN